MTSWICLRHGISSYRSFADNSLIQKDSVVPFDRILLSLFCRYRDIAIDSDNSHEGLFDGYPQTTKDDIPSTFFKHYPAYAAGKMNLSEFARVCNLSRPTVYKYLKLLI